MIVGIGVLDGPKNRTCDARPYRFGGFLNIRPIEEGFPIPTNLHKKREAERLPYRQNIEIYDTSCRDRRPRRS